ncbi:MAG: PQQ-binding-like beta-propeller repeat protein [Planctomycetaceae bacterium]
MKGIRGGDCRGRCRWLWLWAGCVLVLWCPLTAEVCAQARKPAEAVEGSLPLTNPQATRRYQAAEELLLAQRWKDALDQIEPLLNQPGTGLVDVGQGRQVGVEQAARMLLSGLPGEALERHRRRVDPLARRWWESATEVDLRRIVDRAFHSSFGDDALLKLGDLAWERGDPSEARAYWERLVPPFVGATRPPGVPPVAYYPDPQLVGAAVRARLVLSSAALGDRDRALRELATLRREFPEFEEQGLDVAGSSWKGLQKLVESGMGTTWSGIDSWSTLGGSAQRGQVAGPVSLPTGMRWELELTPTIVDFQDPRANRAFEDRFQMPPPQLGRPNSRVAVLATFPVIHQQGVFFCDDRQIWGFDLAGTGRGQPLWGNSPVLFSLEERRDLRGPRARIGLPAHTLTIADDRLFARLGESVATSGPGGPGSVPSTLVCLDLQREGELTWQVTADQVADEVGDWIFCGAPLADNGQLWVVLKKLVPQPVLNVACLEPTTGKLLWNRRILQSSALFGGDFDEQQGLLLSAADGRVYCGTNQGSVIALEARRGTILWVTGYDRDEAERIPDWHDHQILGPNPCVCVDGLVFLAPHDSTSIVALDGASGVRLWQRPIPGIARQVVGVREGRLVVAANQLFGLEVDSGEIAWSVGNESPDSRTRGRCALAADSVFWPRDTEILVVEARTGRRQREVPLAEIQRAGGGNLALADGFLVLAQTDRLLVFWEYLERRKKLEEDLTRTGGSRGTLVAAALHETANLRGEGPRDPEIERRAIDAWQRVLKERGQTPAAGERGVLSRIQVPLFLDVGQARRETGDWESARELFQQVGERAQRLEDRAAAGVRSADVLARLGRWEEAAAVWTRLLQDPLMVRLPREPGATRSIGQTAVIELARLAQLRQGSVVPLAISEEGGNDQPVLPVANGPAEPPAAPARVPNREPATREVSGLIPGRTWTVPLREGRMLACPSADSWDADQAWVLVAGEGLQCHDWATGVVRWSSPLAERPFWMGGTVDSIVLATSSQLVGLDARTGRTRWSRAGWGERLSHPPRRLRCEGSGLVVLDPFRGLEAVDLRSGISLWRFAADGGADERGPAGNPGDHRPGLSPYWVVQDGLLAIQTVSPPRIVFLDTADGFARHTVSTAVRPWREDPWPQPGSGWGLVCQPDLVQRVELDSGTVATLELPPERKSLEATGASGGVDQGGWSDGSGVLLPRNDLELQWIPWGNGGRGWNLTLRSRGTWERRLVCRDERCLYLVDGEQLCAVDVRGGQEVWRRAWTGSGSGEVRQLRRQQEWLVLVLENAAGGLQVQLRDPAEGELNWVCRPQGAFRDWQIVERAGGLVVLTDSELTVAKLSASQH